MVAQIDFTYFQARPWKVYSRLLSYLLFEGRPLTTRGRWINPLLFAFFASAKKLPTISKVTQPTFILGTGRSGTTVLGVVLSMHKKVGFLNEPKALWHAIHPEEDLIGSYTRGQARYRLSLSDAPPGRVCSAHNLFGTYLSTTFSSRIVDKYPELIFRVPFVRAIFPDAKFIFLMRNGWDTCNSIAGWSDRLGKQKNIEVHDWWGVNRRKWQLLVDQIIPEHPDLAPYHADIAQFTRKTDMAAVEWVVTMREGLTLLENNTNHVLGVKFEDLCQKPDVLLPEICHFLELVDDPPFLDYGRKTLHTLESRGKFELHPLIVKPFNETMRRLDYA